MTYPLERVRGYLRTLRLLLGQVRDEAYAARIGVAESRAAQRAQHEQLVEILRSIHDVPAWRRRRLRELRGREDYERAFTEPDPLVSVVIPTYDNYELLRERAIPSVLAQSYQNLEVVVVGDAAPDEARLAVESFADPRIKFFNRPFRGPYPADPETRWQVAGVPPYNDGVHRAAGLWIAPLDDDDAFRPHHIERLVEHARAERLELCYGRFCVHQPGGSTTTQGRYPPEYTQFTLQASVYHAGLAEIFEPELSDAALGRPYDWGMCQRMMESDVRIGMVEEETVDYYPSRLWTPRWQEQLSWTDFAPEWEYVPEGFARAQREDEPVAVGWSTERVARAYRENWPQFLEALDGNGPLGIWHEVAAGSPIRRHDVTAQNAILAYAYAIARAAAGAGKLSVLDWGGALGHFYVLARRLFPDLELEYHCRELPAVCAEGRKVLREVTFHDSDGCLERSYDLVIASSSLQYAEAWRRLLSRLAAAAEGYTFVTRVPIVRHHPSFVVLQRAHEYGYDTEYLGWVLNREELLSAARDAGLELERELVILPEVTVERAPEPFTHAAFLFREPRLV